MDKQSNTTFILTRFWEHLKHSLLQGHLPSAYLTEMNMLESAVQRKICILGTHHAYQYLVPRTRYLQNVKDLIDIHSVDLIAEEATGIPDDSYAHRLIKNVFASRILWKNVDLTGDERKQVPDINQMGLGTLVDFDLHRQREWVWVVRISKAMKNSALLICGLAHTFSVADKFQQVGFAVETHVYLDKLDEENIRNTLEKP